MRKGRIVRAYELFLELPVVIVLVVLWSAGIGLVSFCALALYLCWILLRAHSATRQSASVSSGDGARCPATTINA